MSSVTSGKQMIPVLNALNVNIAVFGNHDFGKFQLLSKLFISKGFHLRTFAPNFSNIDFFPGNFTSER